MMSTQRSKITTPSSTSRQKAVREDLEDGLMESVSLLFPTGDDEEDNKKFDLRAPVSSMNGNGNGNHNAQDLASKQSPPPPSASKITATGLKVLCLLAVQNSSKNLLMRFVMKEKPKFLTSAAVIGSECTKLSLSVLYILFVEKKSIQSIVEFFRLDWKNTILVSVPASAYNLQMTLEYIALANLDAADFSVLVQCKLLFTATFAAIILRKKMKYIQVLSLVLLTVGVMLCNMKFDVPTADSQAEIDIMATHRFRGIMATLGIALSSGFASVYTEKVIKQSESPVAGQYSLAYTQVQLASTSLVTIGIYACIMDFGPIVEYGLFYNFNFGAYLTVLNSALGGLIVAGVLKYADSVLKGYATAISVIATGLLSMVLFGTKLHTVYFMGIVNVVVAILLYNGKNIDQYVCS